MGHAAPPPITVLGRPTCEDTAVIRDRLRTLAVPFREADVDADTGAGRLAESLNHGNRVTPTILFGSTDDVLAEPGLDAFDGHLMDVGWIAARPAPVSFTGDLLARPVPILTLAAPDGSAYRVTELRGRRQSAVFFAHAADCLTCAGYARQLARADVRSALADADARGLVVVPGSPDDARRWREEFTADLPILADRDGRWRRAVGAHTQLGVEGSGALLLALDRFLAPRIGSAAPDAGGLITPLQAAEWLELVSLECNECAVPSAGWGDEGG